uniref:Uncharacterized protein n=1 Tax=Micrurus spixii TaxID=129469 RepID=A0A2D4MNC7_9SAUR
MEIVDAVSIHGSEVLLDEKEDPPVEGMSDDDLKPDQPNFTGLFCPQLFKSLLFKTKNTAHLDKYPSIQCPDPQEESEDLILSQPVSEVEVIPVTQMCSDLINKQWASAAVYPAPTSFDKNFF